ncbi:MAG: hypothetical protein K2Q12_05095 [Rickettsiales bacterium]|nr:hypothetical protein [Rickettsiales bacterium]
MAKYGEVVEYKANEAIQYPDFTITYQGRTHEASPVFKNGFNYQNFIVSSPQGEAKIRWTSGTGEISETRFLVDGKKFYLDVAPRKDGLYIKRTQPILIVHDEEHYQSYRK